MAIERYCDGCGDRMPYQDIAPSVKAMLWTGDGSARHQVRIEIKITRSLNGCANAGDVCIPCIQRVVAEGEFAVPTPREA